MYDIQQEIFTALVNALRAKRYAVYDGFLPAEGTEYPFIFMGEVIQTESQFAKDAVVPIVSQTIHIWHNNYSKRGELSSMAYAAKQVARQIKCEHYPIDCRNVSQQIIDDTTTAQPLLHAVIEVEYVVG